MRVSGALRAPLLCASILLCACARGDKGTGSDVGPPGSGGPGTDVAILPTLVSVVGTLGGVRVDWVAPLADFEAAIFLGTDRNTLFAAPAVEVPASAEPETMRIVSGLVENVVHFAGLGLRRVGESDYVPTGVVLTTRTSAPIYVDPAADPGSADGQSPETAFVDLTSGTLTALLQGGGNVWVRAGSYEVSGVDLFEGVGIYGGFQAEFRLEERVLEPSSTSWAIAAGSRGVVLGPGREPAVLDGIELLGGGAATIGFDALDCPVELRGVAIVEFADRGLRFRNAEDDDLDLRLVDCLVSDNGADGLSLLGAYDVELEGCRFLRNQQEGAELDDLVALDDETARLSVRGSLFADNGAEGLDADLAAPLFGGAVGGRFNVLVQGSAFEGNGADGLLVDFDFENAPGWSADVLVRDCRARANAVDGFHVDADAAGSILLHGLVANANRGDGIGVSSESEPGLVVVSNSIASGNLAAGIRGEFGNRVLAVTQSLLSGNGEVGFESDRPASTITSSIAFLQDNPGDPVASEASVSTSDPAGFENAPEFYGTVLSVNGDRLQLAELGPLALGSVVELTDDGEVRQVEEVVGEQIRLAEVPAGFGAPATLTAFGGFDVDEDYRLTSASPARGAGLAPPGAPAVDAGPLGAPTTDDALELLWPVATVPPQILRPSGSTPIEILFSTALAPSSVTLDAVRVRDDAGTELTTSFFSLEDRIVIEAPSGGWPAGRIRVELHRALRSAGGEPLATPLVIAY